MLGVAGRNRSSHALNDIFDLSKRVAAITLARTEAADRVERWGIEIPDHINPEGFAERLGIEVTLAPLENARAQLTVVNGIAKIKVADWLTPRQRRWAILHELGHYLLKHPSPPAAQLSLPHPPDWLSSARDFEAEADIFAASVLMPTEAVCRMCDQWPMTLDVPRRLADAWQTSLIAATIRITELSLRRCAAVLSQRGEITWVSPTARLVTYYDRFAIGQRLDPWSLAGQFFAHGRALPDQPRPVPTAAWLDLSDVSDEFFIQEHSIAVGADAVLTMLWFPSDASQRRREWRGMRSPGMIMCYREIALDLFAGGQFAADEYRLTRRAGLRRAPLPRANRHTVAASPRPLGSQSVHVRIDADPMRASPRTRRALRSPVTIRTLGDAVTRHAARRECAEYLNARLRGLALGVRRRTTGGTRSSSASPSSSSSITPASVV